jgi:hypothetical protein
MRNWVNIFVGLSLVLIISCDSISQRRWKEFTPPVVQIEINAEGHEGITKYQSLVKEQGYNDIQEWVQHCSRSVAQELYFTSEEANQVGLKRIIYKLNKGGAISYKGGAIPEIEIGFDLDYLMKFAEEHGDVAARDEIYGILCHEIAHGYQKEPKEAGGYSMDTEFFGFIEGAADLVRLKTGGFNPPRFPKEGGSYTSGYNTTAFFYLWICKKYDTDFIRKLNQTAADYKVWTFDKAVQEILNKSAEKLWEEYQKEIANYPW